MTTEVKPPLKAGEIDASQATGQAKAGQFTAMKPGPGSAIQITSPVFKMADVNEVQPPKIFPDGFAGAHAKPENAAGKTESAPEQTQTPQSTAGYIAAGAMNAIKSISDRPKGQSDISNFLMKLEEDEAATLKGLRIIATTGTPAQLEDLIRITNISFILALKEFSYEGVWYNRIVASKKKIIDFVPLVTAEVIKRHPDESLRELARICGVRGEKAIKNRGVFFMSLALQLAPEAILHSSSFDDFMEKFSSVGERIDKDAHDARMAYLNALAHLCGAG